MSRKPYRVHHWTVGQRFRLPIPAGSVLDFTIEREPRTGQLFCVWIEDREGADAQVSVRWSRAPRLFAAWRNPNSVAHIAGEAFAPEIQFAQDRLLMTYLTNPVQRSGEGRDGTLHLHWKRIDGGPWSDAAVVRRRVRPPVPEAHFPYNHQLHEASDEDGRTWALVKNQRFVEPTYALAPTAAPERSLLAPNPWEDQLIYTGVIAGAADRARLVWDRGWHIVRRVFDEARDRYVLEAIALDMSILRHDHNEDGQTDVIDAILELYDGELQYMLWREADLTPLFQELGTMVAVRHPGQHTGRAERADARSHVFFETAATLSHTRDETGRARVRALEVVGRGQRVPVRAMWQAAGAVPNATQWQQHRPDSLTWGLAPTDPNLPPGWLSAGMVVSETGQFTNARAFEAIVEWRTAPLSERWRGHAHVLGHNYAVEVAGVEPLQAPSRHRTATWVGKVYTHRIFANLAEHAPLTRGLRIPLIEYEDDHRFRVLGIAQVVSFE